MKLAAGGAVVLGGGALLSACGGAKNYQPSNEEPAGPVQTGGRLTIGMMGLGSSETMNLEMLNSSLDVARQTQIRQGLWEYRGDTFGAKNVLAESEELSADGKTLVVHLRKGVEFHDGKTLTADDVLWTIGLWKNSSALANVAGVVDFNRVKKLDPNTVQIGLNFPVADFPGIPASTWCSYILQDGTTYTDQKWAGTGPFTLVDAKPGRATFSANKNYWEGAPYLDEVVIDSSFTDQQARFNALQAGSIDIMPAIPFALAKSAGGQGSIRVQSADSPGFAGVYTRVDIPPFNDPRAMQALKLMQDREAIKNAVYNGYGTIGNDLGMSGAPYFASDLKYEYDPDKARSLIKAAGIEGYDGEIICSSSSAGWIELATALAGQSQAVGLNLKAKTIDPSLQFATTGAYNFRDRQLGTTTSSPSTLPGYFMLGLFADAPYNETHWQDPAADKLLFDAIGEQDKARAADKWHQVQLLQHERGGYLVPTNLSYVDASGLKVHGVKTTSANESCDSYYFAKAWKSS